MIRKTNRGGGGLFRQVRGGRVGRVSPRGSKLGGLSKGVRGSARVHDRLYLGDQKPGRRSGLVGFVSGLRGRAQRFRWR